MLKFTTAVRGCRSLTDIIINTQDDTQQTKIMDGRNGIFGHA